MVNKHRLENVMRILSAITFTTCLSALGLTNAWAALPACQAPTLTNPCQTSAVAVGFMALSDGSVGGSFTLTNNTQQCTLAVPVEKINILPATTCFAGSAQLPNAMNGPFTIPIPYSGLNSVGYTYTIIISTSINWVQSASSLYSCEYNNPQLIGTAYYNLCWSSSL